MPSRATPLAARVFLGLFIIWQLLFLFSSNILSLLAKAREVWQNQAAVQSNSPASSETKGATEEFEQRWSNAMSRWAELTGQPQSWSLFAPNVTSIIPFVAVEIIWEDDPSSVTSISKLLAPLAAGNVVDKVVFGAISESQVSGDRSDIQNQMVRLHSRMRFSDNQPADPRHFFKIGHFRLRRYESSIDIAPTSADKERDAVVDAWREDIESRVRDRWKLMHAYMKWQMSRLMKENPGLPEPRQVILWARIYRVPPPEGSPAPWTWQGPEWHAVARWQPRAKWEDNLLPVEMHNPVVDRFESIRPRDEDHHD